MVEMRFWKANESQEFKVNADTIFHFLKDIRLNCDAIKLVDKGRLKMYLRTAFVWLKQKMKVGFLHLYFNQIINGIFLLHQKINLVILKSDSFSEWDYWEFFHENYSKSEDKKRDLDMFETQISCLIDRYHFCFGFSEMNLIVLDFAVFWPFILIHVRVSDYYMMKLLPEFFLILFSFKAY